MEAVRGCVKSNSLNQSVRNFDPEGSFASIGVDVVPGVAEIALGDIDPSAMANFGSNAAVQSAIADTRSCVTAPIDELLYNTLPMLGIKIGEADVRFPDARCQRSVLAQ